MNNSNDLFEHLRLSDMSDFENIELIPIGSEGMGSDDKMGVLSEELPILPIRNIVLFPGMVTHYGESAEIRSFSKESVQRRSNDWGVSTSESF